MKILTFGYTKENSDYSERTLMVLGSPSEKQYYTGIDLSELDPVTANEFVNEYEQLHNEFLENAKKLQKKYDLAYKYRQFIPDRMSDVVEI